MSHTCNPKHTQAAMLDLVIQIVDIITHGLYAYKP